MRTGHTGLITLKVVALTFCAAVAFLCFGFMVFAVNATRDGQPLQAKADAIVVLTGGVRRISAAGQLLNAKLGDRLLISGVNKKATKRDVRRLAGVEDALLSCCVDLGYEAVNTRGNASETRAWARKHGFKRLIVVTASYHMPRSLAELARELPDVELVPHPVVPERFRNKPWWLNSDNVSFLVREYAKFLPAAAQSVAARVSKSTSAEIGGLSQARLP